MPAPGPESTDSLESQPKYKRRRSTVAQSDAAPSTAPGEFPAESTCSSESQLNHKRRRLSVTQSDEASETTSSFESQLNHKRRRLTVTQSDEAPEITAPREFSLECLPPELIREIFHFCNAYARLAVYHANDHFPPFSPWGRDLEVIASREALPMRLAQISGRLREVALDTPGLWSSFSVQDHLPARKVDLAMWLERSRKMPLSIHLQTNNGPIGRDEEIARTNELLAMMLRDSGRLMHMSLKLEGPTMADQLLQVWPTPESAPLLESLMFDFYDYDKSEYDIELLNWLATFPMLRRLHWGWRGPYRIQLLDVPWAQLTHANLVLSHLPIGAFFEIFIKCTRAVQLVHRGFHETTPQAFEVPDFLLPEMRSLSIRRSPGLTLSLGLAILKGCPQLVEVDLQLASLPVIELKLQLPELTSLTLSANGDISGVLDCLTLPALRILKYSNTASRNYPAPLAFTPVSAWHEFFDRSKCELETLELEDIHILEEVLLGYLSDPLLKACLRKLKVSAGDLQLDLSRFLK